MARPPVAQVCHVSSRRLRIRVPERRRDAHFFEAAAERISTWTGVKRVEGNPLTASILIHRADTQQLFAEAAETDLFELDLKSNSDTVVDRAARKFEAADGVVRRWTEGQIDIR